MGSQEGAQTPDASEIYTKLKIGNAFALQVEMQVLSDKPGQSFELGTYQGHDRSSGYLIKFLNQKQQSLALIRASRSGSSVIDVVRQTRLLQNRKPSTLIWLRYNDGEMKLLIDGEEILSTKDKMFNTFDGVTFLNLGGNYAISSISLFGPSRQ